MNKFLCGVFVFLFLTIAGSVSAQESEQINHFASRITINTDTSLSIVEEIDYFTPDEKHGIFRYIPEKYRKDGMVFTSRVSDIFVTDGNGKAVPFSISRDTENVTMKIGDPDAVFAGERKYIISYTVEDGLLRQKDYDELYWDITGEGWSFPILSSSAEIKSPNAKINKVVCFTGEVGGTETNCMADHDGEKATITTEKIINYGENFTVGVELNKENNLLFPSATTSLFKKIRDNLFLLLLPLPGLMMFLAWFKWGRDFRFNSPNIYNLDPKQPSALRPLFEPINTPLVYEPIKDLTPGEAGALLDEKVDHRDIVAEIIDLARQKLLTIKKVKKEGFLQFGHDYLMEKTKKEGVRLPEHQKYLLDHIFSSSDSVKISDLRGTFYVHMAKAEEMITKRLKERKLFSANPQTARALGVMGAILISGAVFVLVIGNLVFLQEGLPILVYLVSAMVAAIFGWNMPQKTAVGTNLALQVKGLRETILVGKWREEIKEKDLFIEEVLPFAIALGVIGKLAKDMAALKMTPPTYASSGFAGDNLAWSGFISDFSRSAVSGLSYNPSSSSYGGGSSGGSSGGGGGGGGGGSW